MNRASRAHRDPLRLRLSCEYPRRIWLWARTFDLRLALDSQTNALNCLPRQIGKNARKTIVHVLLCARVTLILRSILRPRAV